MNEVMEKQLPVYTVRGSNWKIDIHINEYNNEFPAKMQMLEAASQAIEACKGLNDLFIVLDENEEKAFIGPVLYVYPKDKSPQDGSLVFTHNALADAGLYKESVASLDSLKKHIEAFRIEYGSHFDSDELIAEQLKEIKIVKKNPVKKTKRKKP